MAEQDNIENIVKSSDSNHRKYTIGFYTSLASVVAVAALLVYLPDSIPNPSIKVHSVKTKYDKVVNSLDNRRNCYFFTQECISDEKKNLALATEHKDSSQMKSSLKEIDSYFYVSENLKNSINSLKIDSARLYDNTEWAIYRENVASIEKRNDYLTGLGIFLVMLSSAGMGYCRAKSPKSAVIKDKTKTTA